MGGEDLPIVLLSRESNSGTYVYFLENVVRQGKKSDLMFSPDTLLMPSSEGISNEVRQNPNAIGYDGLGYVTSDQKVLAVAKDAASPTVLPSVDTVNDNTYPISRPLYMYTAGEPQGVVKIVPGLDSGPGGTGNCADPGLRAVAEVSALSHACHRGPWSGLASTRFLETRL